MMDSSNINVLKRLKSHQLTIEELEDEIMSENLKKFGTLRVGRYTHNFSIKTTIDKKKKNGNLHILWKHFYLGKLEIIIIFIFSALIQCIFCVVFLCSVGQGQRYLTSVRRKRKNFNFEISTTTAHYGTKTYI